jgi:hypothetical protein
VPVTGLCSGYAGRGLFYQATHCEVFTFALAELKFFLFRSRLLGDDHDVSICLTTSNCQRIVCPVVGKSV